ncbi:MAG: NAD-dependent dehydratase [Bacteroidetes bacterium]|nr:NAD-dependent dehydratase [Bacteroidota bacterium]
MVIGNGLVAKAFSSYFTDERFLIFASGVSNSKSATEEAFHREKELLLQHLNQYPSAIFVYFSTCSILDPDLKESPYTFHKKRMEELIIQNNRPFYIFRLSNLAGHTRNPHTFLNFFYWHIKKKESFELWKKSERNIIDVVDVFKVCNHIMQQQLFLNKITNVANPENYKVLDIVKIIEDFCQTKGKYKEIDRGAGYAIDIADIRLLFQSLSIEFGDHYLLRLLEKYYAGNEV